MEWQILRRGVDLILGLTVYGRFCRCDSLVDILQTLSQMSDIEKVGIVTVAVILLSSVAEAIKYIRSLLPW